ncbi:MAG: S1 RNA-binding domain-containing protein [Treponemataceae bacterium]|nr:S1 RNA-binding domain-containing protein [Treponemataceae bacterium]
MKNLEPGDEINAQIVAISGDTIFLDLNSKSEGVLAASELTDDKGVLSVQTGDFVKAFFTGYKDGAMQFTTRISGEKADKSMLENAWKNGIPVEGHVEKEIKGGYEVKIGSARAFCPYSQMGGRRRDENDVVIGKHLSFLIQEYKEDGRNILVSNRAILEAEHKAEIEKLRKTLTEGTVVKGTVQSLQSYGAFVDINGFQALLPVSEIRLSRVENIEEVLSVGQEVTAKVIRTDWDRERVSISTKALIENPWDSVLTRLSVGQKISGTISRIADFGLFVTLEPGIDGLVHASTIEDVSRNTNLRKKFRSGQTMDVEILSIDTETNRISLKPATAAKVQDDSEEYLNNQVDDAETYNPFAALLKKK